jgi:hypothetical protein
MSKRKERQAARPSALLNWFGKTPHPSDCLVHWRDTVGYRGVADFDETIAQLRADWDLLTATDAGKAALARLLSAQYEKASQDQAEDDAGASL